MTHLLYLRFNFLEKFSLLLKVIFYSGEIRQFRRGFNDHIPTKREYINFGINDIRKNDSDFLCQFAVSLIKFLKLRKQSYLFSCFQLKLFFNYFFHQFKGLPYANKQFLFKPTDSFLDEIYFAYSVFHFVLSAFHLLQSLLDSFEKILLHCLNALLYLKEVYYLMAFSNVRLYNAFATNVEATTRFTKKVSYFSLMFVAHKTLNLYCILLLILQMTQRCQ